MDKRKQRKNACIRRLTLGRESKYSRDNVVAPIHSLFLILRTCYIVVYFENYPNLLYGWMSKADYSFIYRMIICNIEKKESSSNFLL